jgi:hypothetical protein
MWGHIGSMLTSGRVDALKLEQVIVTLIPHAAGTSLHGDVVGHPHLVNDEGISRLQWGGHRCVLVLG